MGNHFDVDVSFVVCAASSRESTVEEHSQHYPNGMIMGGLRGGGWGGGVKKYDSSFDSFF